MKSIDAEGLAALQKEKTRDWHTGDMPALEGGLPGLAEENHKRNFLLWHEEDKARRDDLGSEHVRRAKRNIDRYNQERNNFIEKMDEWLWNHLSPRENDCPMNSETPGMMIDRLSILALKEYHLDEESRRKDAAPEHREACRRKLGVIRRQHRDLLQCLREMLDDAARGRRGFRVYYQMKMYNDPALNPELYRAPAASCEKS